MLVNIPITWIPKQEIPLLTPQAPGPSLDPGSPTKPFCPFSKDLALTEGFLRAVILYNTEVNPTAL